MKNRIKNILKAIALVSLAMFQFFGCKQIEDVKDSEKVAYITINNSLARTVNPEASIEKMTNFVLKGTLSGEEEQKLGSWDNSEALKKARVPINPGLWDFKLTAQQGNISFLATIEKKQIEIALNNLEFNLSMSSMDLKNGKGSINISFTGLKNIVNYVKARAFYLDGKEARIFLDGSYYSTSEYLKVDSTGEKTTATLNVSDVPSGTYLIEFEFYYEEYKTFKDDWHKVSHDTKLGTYTELVNVVADCTSSALIENLDLDTHLYKLTYNPNGGYFYVDDYKYFRNETLTFSYSSSSNMDLTDPYVGNYYVRGGYMCIVKKSGYDFEGWYLESPDELFDGNFQGMTGDKTLYAKWKPGKWHFYVDSYYWDYSKNQWESLYEKQKYYGITEEKVTEERIKEIVSSNDEYKGYVFDHVKNLGTISPNRYYDDTVKLYLRPAPCEIVLKLNGGTINGNTGNITISGYYNQSIDIEDPELDGFCFEKWTPSIPEIFSLEKTEHTASYNSIGRFIEYNDYILAETELTYKAWYSVYQWATSDERGDKKYVFRNPGREGCAGIDGAAPTENSNEPVTNISEADAVLWCNAASEREGLEPLYYEFKREFSYSSTVSSSIEVLRNEADYGYNNREATVNENGLHQYPIVYNKNSYHLPTSIEWKEMARGTSPTDYLWAGTNSTDELNDYAVTANNSNHKTATVKTKKANSIGLYDMTGNVKEMIMILPREENTYPCKCSYFDTIGGSYRYGFDGASYIYPTINGDGDDYQYGDNYGDLADYGIRISKSKLK